MRFFVMLFLCVLIYSCNDNAKRSAAEPEEKIASEEKIVQKDFRQNYTSQKWHFSLKYPESYQIYEGGLPGEVPVVNVYLPGEGQEPPLAVHEKASASYIAFLPEGFGVDGPTGERKSLKEWEGSLPLSFSVDRENSFVYLLKNGSPRGFSLRFYSAPPGWSEAGSIQIFYSINDFQAECFGKDSKAISMQECDPLMGDRIVHSGELDKESQEKINSMLESLHFQDPKQEGREISELIKLEQPEPGDTISSPLKLKGDARGYWFFEATAPFEIVTSDGKLIAESYIEATNNWMTEDFVPFEARVTFERPKEKRGYIIMRRANASGKPEHDRVLRVPVIFN